MFWRSLLRCYMSIGRGFASDAVSQLGADLPLSDSEREAFAALVTLHTPAMVRVAASLVGVADAEDAAQEAILRAWKAWAHLRDQNAVRAWLLRITVNVCQQWLRGEMGKRQRLTMPLLDGSAEWLLALDGDPGDSDHAAVLDLRRALAQLKPALYDAIVLRYYGGMDVVEISTALGIPVRTVRKRLLRAYDQLRQHLAAVPEAEEEDFHV
ncbi:MAG: sigma-70 family RNA polymerase sigma factor [Ktedonobacterales bacterium]|nr:sigma-70 family RNA polymerase sigma factor [Ktedonobacterales bacterium]